MKVFRVVVVSVLLIYGTHYFGYFLRVRYFGAIEPLKELDPAVHAILRYLGHIIFVIVLAVYAWAVKEDRKYFMLFHPKNNKLRYLFIGMAVGFLMNAACVMAAALHGDITIGSVNDVNIGLLIAAFIAVLIQASAEELESRAFLFGKMEDGGVPTVIAVFVSGAFFSYLHATNPGFGIQPFISILLAGIAYLMIFKWTGSIWAACGIHQLWNVTQDFIFGLPNSGNPSTMSIFSSEANRNSFFYDTEFGVEGSWFCIILHIAVIVLLAFLIKRNNTKSTAKASIA